MCYFAYTEEERQEHTAKEDFKVFKVMRAKKSPSGEIFLSSFYYPKKWHVGETATWPRPLVLHHHEETFIHHEECSTIDLGYHSYHVDLAQISFNLKFHPNVYVDVICVSPTVKASGALIDEYYVGNTTINEGRLVTPWTWCDDWYTYTLDEFKKYMRKRTLDNSTGVIIADCTIPKGATYYINSRGEIVSNAIRLDSYDALT
jgi:hypothetical protein